MKKKIFSLILAGTMALSMVACGGSKEEAPAAEAPAAEAPAAEAEAPAADVTTYNIGILQIVQHPALDAATQGFIDALNEAAAENGTVAFTFDSQDASGETTNCSTIANQFVSDKVDLILANATAPLQACAAATADIPIIGTSITDYASALEIDGWTGTVGNNISGTSDLAPLDGQAAMLNELFPEAKTVGVIYCSAEANSAYQYETIKPYLEGFGYTVEAYAFTDTNDLNSVVTSACQSCDVLYIPTDNTAASNTEAINNIASPAGIPIIAGEEGICSGCGVATLSISYYDLGYQSGKMAFDVLVNGADITTMAVQYTPESGLTKKYVASRCESLGISVPDTYVAIEE